MDEELLDELAIDEDELEEAIDDVEEDVADEVLLTEELLTEELADDNTELEDDPLTGALETELLSLDVPASPPEHAANSSVLSVTPIRALCDERHKAEGEKNEWDMVLEWFRK